MDTMDSAAESTAPSQQEEIVLVRSKVKLEILNEIKNAQLQHGLRLNDYERYRQFCARRLRRLRRTLKFTNGKGKFHKKRTNPSNMNSAGHLSMLLFEAERCWAYGMQRKEEFNESGDRRARLHFLRKFRKAEIYALKLQRYCARLADKRTNLEAEAYTSVMSATRALELEQWAVALKNFATAKTIYENLGKVGDPEFAALCVSRVEEIEPGIRYATYKQSRAGGATPKSEDMASDSNLRAKLDDVLQESNTADSDGVGDITWQGRKVPVKTPKVRNILTTCKEHQLKLEGELAFDKKMAVFDKLLMSYADMAVACRDGIKALNVGKHKTSKQEMQEKQFQDLENYALYTKINKSVERNMAIVANLKQKQAEKKRSRSEDFVRVYQSLVQNMVDLKQESVIPDPENKQERESQLTARELSYRAHRCYYLAITYSANKKWAESSALLDRAEDYLSQSKSQAEQLDQNDKSSLDELNRNIQSKRSEIHAQSFLSKIVSESSEAKEKEVSSSASLLDNLKDPNFNNTSGKLSNPPNFESLSCRPQMFDLAFSSAGEFPSLEARKKAASSGFWGFFS